MKKLGFAIVVIGLLLIGLGKLATWDSHRNGGLGLSEHRACDDLRGKVRTASTAIDASLHLKDEQARVPGVNAITTLLGQLQSAPKEHLIVAPQAELKVALEALLPTAQRRAVTNADLKPTFDALDHLNSACHIKT